MLRSHGSGQLPKRAECDALQEDSTASSLATTEALIIDKEDMLKNKKQAAVQTACDSNLTASPKESNQRGDAEYEHKTSPQITALKFRHQLRGEATTNTTYLLDLEINRVGSRLSTKAALPLQILATNQLSVKTQLRNKSTTMSDEHVTKAKARHSNQPTAEQLDAETDEYLASLRRRPTAAAQSWTLDGYPIVDGKYHDLVTNEVTTLSPGKSTTYGPPSVEIYWLSTDDKDRFQGTIQTTKWSVTDHFIGIGRLVESAPVFISAVNATMYNINVIVLTKLTRTEMRDAIVKAFADI